ncbi:MAG: hypothetical protein NC299_14285 [Lachnospiraceae bacterium]|nr:hypothetical protein [Ruminococcus sp.]MCM1276505.1 hypothetical protein [Lachnospiraceae bacterium]
MRKLKTVTERDIVTFAVEFVNKLSKFDIRLLGGYEDDAYSIRWSNKMTTLIEIYENELTVDGVLEHCDQTDMDVREFTGDDNCVAYLVCEGDLYEKMYNCEAYGDGGEQAKKLLQAARYCADKNGMHFDWAGGALMLRSTRETVLEDFKPETGRYVCGSASICREERQYSLFLYNILRKFYSERRRDENHKAVKDIFKACSLPSNSDIREVFYEAALMRDIFERNRRLVLCSDPYINMYSKKFNPDPTGKFNSSNSFNYKLLEYLKEENYIDPNTPYDFKDERNLGGKDSNFGDIVREMMQAKPDIAVVYWVDGSYYLLFLECKFESDEKPYKSKKKQREIQWLIADFLCKYYFTDLKVSPLMENRRSCLVRFVRNEPKKPNEIEITTLIDLNKEFLS